MKKKYLSIILLIAISTCAQVQSWKWVKPIGGNMFRPTWICSDNTSSLYVGGDLLDSIYADQHKVFRAKGQGLFMAKFKPDGTCTWLKRCPGFYRHCMQADKFSNIYTAWCDSTYQYNNGQTAHFAKYDSSGNPLWQQSVHGAWATYCKIDLLLPDTLGNIYVKGWYADTLSVGGFTLINPGFNCFLGKCKDNGDFLWVRHTSFDGRGTRNMTLAGNSIFIQTIDTLMQLDTAGTLVASHPVIQGGYSKVDPILIADKQGYLYASTAFDQSIQIGTTNISDAYPCGQFYGGCGDIAVFKMNQQGIVQWTKHVFSTATDMNAGLVLTDNGKLNVLGLNEYLFNCDTLQIHEQNNLFNMNCSSAGNVNSVLFAEGNASYLFAQTAASLTNDVYATGGMQNLGGYAVFGSDTVKNYAGLFVAGLSTGSVISNGVEYFTKEEINVYPNPSSGKFLISPSKARLIAVYDINGQMIEVNDVNAGNLSRGLYFAVCEMNGKVFRRKVIID